jgi:glycosyltransferase involved in cell wall biosynthesis
MSKSAQITTEPLVGIVTPVHNCEKYLGECIESILRQTYTHFEYAIVNNKSTDGTLAVALQYAKLDSRITVYDNDRFLPVMQNFNNAISKISREAKYCKIVCADDWISEDYLAKTVALAEKHPSIGIVSSYRLVGQRIVPEIMPYRHTIFSGLEMARMNLLDGPYTFGSPTALLYRSQIVFQKEKFYKEERTVGDTEACYETLKEWDFGFVHQILSFNRVHELSLTSKSLYFKRNIPDHIYMLLRYGKFYLNNKEYECKRKVLLDKYYMFLGQNIHRFKDAAFRKYHEENFEILGLKSHNYIKIIRCFILYHLKNMIDLKAHLKRLWSKMVNRGRLRMMNS